MTRKNNPLTWRRLRELLDYDRVSGVFTWRVAKPGIAAGDEAGTLDKDGRVAIGIDGTIYSAARLAWFYCTQEWPASRIIFRDGDRANNALRNLVQTSDYYSVKKVSRYQRELRQINAEAMSIILADPEMLQVYNQGTPVEARRLIKHVRDNLRVQRRRAIAEIRSHHHPDETDIAH